MEAVKNAIDKMEALMREKLLERGLYIRAFDYVLKEAKAEVLAEVEQKEETEKVNGGFAYRHSNCELTKKTKTGKEITYAVCDICGAEHRSNHGVTYNFNWFGGFVYSRTKLCRSCASKMRPMLCRVSDMISEAEFELKESKRAKVKEEAEE